MYVNTFGNCNYFTVGCVISEWEDRDVRTRKKKTQAEVSFH